MMLDPRYPETPEKIDRELEHKPHMHRHLNNFLGIGQRLAAGWPYRESMVQLP